MGMDLIISRYLEGSVLSSTQAQACMPCKPALSPILLHMPIQLPHGKQQATGDFAAVTPQSVAHRIKRRLP